MSLKDRDFREASDLYAFGCVFVYATLCLCVASIIIKIVIISMKQGRMLERTPFSHE